MTTRPRITLRDLALPALGVLVAALIVAAMLGVGGGDHAPGEGSVGAGDNIVDNGGATEIVTAAFPTGRDTDEVSASGARPIAPCRLVPKKKAERILGAGVKVTERPQGPTCVYTGSGREVDLVVEKVPLKVLKRGARSVEPVTIAGRRGWCLRYQGTSVVIGAGAGRVLHVTGPCQAGVRFAAVALPRIPRAH